MTNNKFWDEQYINIGRKERPYLESKLFLKQTMEPRNSLKAVNYILAALALVLYVSVRARNTISTSYNLLFAIITIAYTIPLILCLMESEKFRILRSAYWGLGLLLFSYFLTTVCTAFLRMAFDGRDIVYRLTKFPIVFFACLIVSIFIVSFRIYLGNEKSIEKITKRNKSKKRWHSGIIHRVSSVAFCLSVYLGINYSIRTYPSFPILETIFIILLLTYALFAMVSAQKNIYVLSKIHNECHDL